MHGPPEIAVGPDGTITDVNAAAERATGYGRPQLLGSEFSDYFTEPGLAHAGYERAFRDGSVRDYALELRHRDGHTTSVLDGVRRRRAHLLRMPHQRHHRLPAVP